MASFASKALRSSSLVDRRKLSERLECAFTASQVGNARNTAGAASSASAKKISPSAFCMAMPDEITIADTSSSRQIAVQHKADVTAIATSFGV